MHTAIEHPEYSEVHDLLNELPRTRIPLKVYGEKLLNECCFVQQDHPYNLAEAEVRTRALGAIASFLFSRARPSWRTVFFSTDQRTSYRKALTRLGAVVVSAATDDEIAACTRSVSTRHKGSGRQLRALREHARQLLAATAGEKGRS